MDHLEKALTDDDSDNPVVKEIHRLKTTSGRALDAKGKSKKKKKNTILPSSVFLFHLLYLFIFNHLFDWK